jgi:gamma-glutamyltranspeptidase/glutathione hydrolase
MVVSASTLASKVGVDIMKSGGNAIDAAVATGFALAVTHPQAGNIGGGGFLVAKLASGRQLSIDFREIAPSQSHRDMFLNDDGSVINDMSVRSHCSSGVPGSVAGLLEAWERFGSDNISLKQLIEPAISLAKDGFNISDKLATTLNMKRTLFEQDIGAATIFIRQDSKSWKGGDVLVQNDLAMTLSRIAEDGIDGFYNGETAALIVKEMENNNGLITFQDLQNYSPIVRDVVKGTYKNYDIISMGPPSSGGILLIHMLNMLENFSIDSMKFNSSDYIHLLTEVERLAYADRAEHLGDSDFWNVPIEMLLSKEYARLRTENISMVRATPSKDVLAGSVNYYEGNETTHYSVVDKDMNAVSVTTTINTAFGSGKLVDGAGFLLNNEMDDFSKKPGVPNVYGLIGNEANAIAPNKRPLSSMTPTIILRDHKPFIIIGSPGGSTIITTVLQVFLNVIEHGMNIYEAVSSPRIHSQWLPDQITIEKDALKAGTISQLERKGHFIKINDGKIGSANGILIDENGFWGGPDPRWENSAVGY